ncbi:MAG: hypothetical protein OEW08_13375, partial [Gammaproteobacteria bacterium]|nr:hypothetical protein [Gammaproteobacteria bacterium]
MNVRMLKIAALSFVIAPVFAHTAAHAADAQLQAMAGMVLTINHYPDDAQKGALQKIVNDANATSANRALAGALLHMQHAVADADKQKLKAIMDDKAAPEQAKQLA